MRGKLLATAFAVLAMSSTGAFAQQGTIGSSAQGVQTNNMMYPNGNFRSEYESRMKYNVADRAAAAQTAARNIADCVMKRAKGKAGDMLGGNAEDPNFEKLQKGLSGKYSSCNTEGSAGVPMLAINTALAEQILRTENRSLQPHFTPTDLAVAKAFYASAGGLSMDSLGRCLAVYSPGMVNMVLTQASGSAGEKQALNNLFAETPECGVRSSPSNIPTDEQRNAIATGLYQWLHRG